MKFEGQMSFDGSRPVIKKRLNEEQTFVLRQLLMNHPHGLSSLALERMVERSDFNGFVRRMKRRGLVRKDGDRLHINPDVLREDW
jgi:DNA-binding MarR family transcriptional regulator